MKPSFFSAAALVFSIAAGTAAHAETVNSLCLGAGRSTMIEVNGEFAGTYFDIEVDQPIKGTIKFYKLEGKDSTLVVPFAGTVTLSSKGPYFDLLGNDDTSLLIAPPANGMPSELTIGGNKIQLMCD